MCSYLLGGGFPSEFVKPFTFFLSKEGWLSLFIFPLPGLVPLRLGLDSPGPTAHLQAVTYLTPMKAFGWALQTLEAGQQQFFAVGAAEAVVSDPHLPPRPDTAIRSGDITTHEGRGGDQKGSKRGSGSLDRLCGPGRGGRLVGRALSSALRPSGAALGLWCGCGFFLLCGTKSHISFLAGLLLQEQKKAKVNREPGASRPSKGFARLPGSGHV